MTLTGTAGRMPLMQSLLQQVCKPSCEDDPASVQLPELCCDLITIAFSAATATTTLPHCCPYLLAAVKRPKDRSELCPGRPTEPSQCMYNNAPYVLHRASTSCKHKRPRPLTDCRWLLTESRRVDDTTHAASDSEPASLCFVFFQTNEEKTAARHQHSSCMHDCVCIQHCKVPSIPHKPQYTHIQYKRLHLQTWPCARLTQTQTAHTHQFLTGTLSALTPAVHVAPKIHQVVSNRRTQPQPAGTVVARGIFT